MAFSKRIKYLASLVEKNVNVIDIGCDHGLLDIYLTLYNNNKCLAADINEKALQKAKENINKYNLNIPTVVSDGLQNITILENTTCVIAGMGTNTMIDILNVQKAKNIDTYILQTNNDYYCLRKYMVSKGYYIFDEITFIDKNIRYIIIKFKKGLRKYSNIELELGPILIQKNNDNVNRYFQELYEENDKILKKLPKKYIIKILKLKKRNKMIKKLFEKR